MGSSVPRSGRRRGCLARQDVLAFAAAAGVAGNSYPNVAEATTNDLGAVGTNAKLRPLDGAYAYGSYPDPDMMFQQRAVELDRNRRAEILTRMQQVLYERVVTTHLMATWQLAFVNGVGPHVGESSFGRTPGYASTAPYEDLTIKTA